MGGRGLGFRGGGNTPKNWDEAINSKNAKRYGILLKKHSTRRVSAEALQEAYDGLDASLATINQFGILVGLKPDELPKVVLHYGKYSSDSYGAANMKAYGKMDVVDPKTGEVLFTPNAIINLYESGLRHSPDTAAHEMYHAFEALWIQTTYQDKYDRLNAWCDNKFSKAICFEALKKIGRPRGVDAWREEARTIYRTSFEKNNPEYTYASSEGRGQFAETVTCTIQAALRYGEHNISPYGQAILKELRRAIKEWRKYR